MKRVAEEELALESTWAWEIGILYQFVMRREKLSSNPIETTGNWSFLKDYLYLVSARRLGIILDFGKNKSLSQKRQKH